MRNVEWVRLGDVLISQPKSKIKAGDGLIEGKYKFFTSSNVQSKYIDGYNYKEPALIFGTGGNASIHFCDKPFSTSTDCLVFYSKSSEILKTIFIYLSGNMQLLEDGFKGAGLKHISKEFILSIQIPLPPIEAQRKVASELDKINCLISKRKSQLEKLDLFVKAKFIEMFGDPVKNPMGWDVNQLSEISTSRLGKMLDAKQQTGENRFPYLANFNVQWFKIETNQLNEMDFNHSEQQEFKLMEGDLLVCEGGEVGRCAIWHNQITPCYFQKALHRIRCNNEIILPDYLAWWFKFRYNYNAFEDVVGSQATIPHLTGIKLKSLSIVIPPITLQKQYADYVAKVEKAKNNMQKGLKKLEILYKAKMQEYFE